VIVQAGESAKYFTLRYDFQQGANNMATQIVRVGNTLTVEVPEELLVQASLPVGEPVEWVLNGNGSIALVKLSDSAPVNLRKRKTLEEILEGIPEGACMQEIDWGPPRGVEFW
jgi:antitoxin component of MazEF toxin-antitoxin module